jgi:hypothetical protein
VTTNISFVDSDLPTAGSLEPAKERAGAFVCPVLLRLPSHDAQPSVVCELSSAEGYVSLSARFPCGTTHR